MPITKVQAPDGSTIKVEHPEGASQDSIISFAQSQYKEDEPGVGKIVGGLATEVAIGEGAKATGALVGSAFGPAGAALGYVGGALTGGVTGSIAAQEIEGRDEISWGRVVADTALNLIPGGLGKAKKGVGVLPRLAQEGAKRAAGGAVIATGGAQIEKAVEDRELLTQDELGNAVFVGAGLGLGLGAAGELMKKAYPKFGGRGGSILNEAYEKGDPDATQVVETLAGENPVGKGTRLKRMIFERVVPSKLVGKDATLDAIRAKNEAGAATDIASTVRRIINDASKDATADDMQKLDDYLLNQSDELPAKFQPIKSTLDDAREKVDEYQNILYSMYKAGELDIDPRIAAKLEGSIRSKDYFTREYRFYEDSTYTPSAQATNNLKESLMKDSVVDGKKVKAMTSEQADEFINDLKDSRSDSVRLMNRVYGNKRVLSRKKELTNEMKDFLGEYTDPGERFFGTLSRLGKLASYEAGNRRIANELLSNNIGTTKRAEGLEPLVIRGRPMRAGDKRVPRKVKTPDGYAQSSKLVQGETIYVPADVNRSLNELYGSGVIKDAGPWFSRVVGDLLATTTAGAKFVRVPLNLASYPVQLVGNAVLTAGQGFNPFRGYKKGMRVAINEATPDRFKSGKIPLKELSRLKELGIVNKGVTASDIRDGFKSGIASRFFTKATKGVGNAYNAFDTAQRISVYENYKKFLREIIPDTDIKRIGQKEFEQLAADLTNDTYMNYDRINKGFRALSRYGILNEFGAFNFELARTTWNQGRLAKQMVNGEFADKLQKKYGFTLNPQTVQRIRNEGLKRFAALSAVLTAGTTIPMVLNREGGIDEEKEQALRETGLADWERDQALHLRKDGNKIRSANLGYQIPSAELSTILEAGFKGESFTDATGRMIDALWSKFGGDLTINMKNIVGAVNNMDPRTGRQISAKPKESLGRAFDLVGYYLGETFTPGTISDLKKLDERETIDNVLRYTLGYRVRNFDLMDGAGYKFRDINKNINNIRSSYTGDTFREDNILGAYNQKNNIYRANIQDAIRHVNNLRKLDVSDEEIEAKIKKLFSKAQTSDIMNGVVNDMPISAGVTIGDRIQKRQRYVDLVKKLPRESALQMLQQDFDRKKIKRSDVQAILQQIQLERL